MLQKQGTRLKLYCLSFRFVAEQSIDFTMMCVFFIFVSEDTFSSIGTKDILKESSLFIQPKYKQDSIFYLKSSTKWMMRAFFSKRK